jgi:glycosyltransferase involved in cell wall biosynthesis
VQTILPALLDEGCNPIAMTSDLAEGCTDPQVRSFSTSRGGIGRALDFVGYRAFPTAWHDRRVAAAILNAVRTLHLQDPIELLEMEETFGWAGDVARDGTVPVVIRLHGPLCVMGPLSPTYAVARSAHRLRREGSAIAGAAGVSAVSRDVLDRTKRFYGFQLNDAAVIPNPVSQCAADNRWNLANCNKDRILFVGRFDGHKGGDTIIDAFAHITKQNPHLTLTFVGPDPGFVDETGRRWQISEYLERRLGRSPERNRVEWFGFKTPDEIRDLRRNAMVTVVCSRYETFGMTAAEAMAAGCPIVATDTGGLPELIEHDRNGLLCQPNDPVDLAEKILDLLSHPGMAAALGAQAVLDAASRYHPKIVARQTIDFYRDILERSRHPEHNQ